jgi:preprotein translocase subunit SecF
VGKELRDKTMILIVLSLLAIILYIAFAFSRIKEPLSSWYYGGVSLAALFLDILVPLGIFAYLGSVYGVQITIPVVVALLTVIGYSINNTVVVFDRIRENTILQEKNKEFQFEEVIQESLRQTLSRQLNTAISTLLVLGAIFFFGGETMRYFALALIVGITMGIYSSLFVAPTLLAYFAQRKGVDSE